MKQKKNNKQKCIKSICVDKSAYKITRVLLDDLYNQAYAAKQDPYLEILLQSKDKEYFKLNCKVEKVKL